MLNNSLVTANIPAADLERARGFYADKPKPQPDLREPGPSRPPRRSYN